MLDLKGQYSKIQKEIDNSVKEVIDSCSFINGPAVQSFESELAAYLGSKYVMGCANGTDALQIALMALELKAGDEVIVPAFTFAATAEVVALLGMIPVFVDVDPVTFNIKPDEIERAISPKTKVIMPVHLFGQAAPMEEILKIAKRHSLFIIEDNAQALGSKYTFSDGSQKFLGTIGDIGCTSFFPTKNLGCYGDGGAIFTQDAELASKIKMVTDHGQKLKYHHDIIGCNSRLDSIQAAILSVKLKHLDSYSASRAKAASTYRELLKDINQIILPQESGDSNHVYHQFTIRVRERERLKEFLASKEIASMTYYPLSLNKQKAFASIAVVRGSLANSETLAEEVLSLPMHTELTDEIQERICSVIKEFYNG